jgi:N-acetylglucosaminyl-diphospho-decaprenol L-rhamnosyltransferase
MADFATVFCVVPVHNRLDVTRRCLDYLCVQDYPSLQFVVIDDGSTDGTGEYLAQCGLPNLTTLNGDGNLWWGGAMHKGIAQVVKVATRSDYLLMLNDDVVIEEDYVSTLVAESISHEGSVIGSAQKIKGTGALLSCGCKIDYWGMRIQPVDALSTRENVDALPGRGVLYPMPAVLSAGNINIKAFPHYLGDLEYSARIKEKGWKIFISSNADVYTSAVNSDESLRRQGLKQEYFSFRSKNSLLQRLWFFSLRGPVWLRFWALPRYMVFGGWRMLRKMTA